MPSLPVLLMNPRVLLVGGGKVAYRRAKVLLENQVEFKVVAERCVPEFNDLDVELVYKQFEVGDLHSFELVVDATGCPSVAEAILLEKQTRHLLVNIAADPERSDFFFSSLINCGKLKIAVSTDGASPTVGKIVRDKIKSILPLGINEILQTEANDRKAGVIKPETSRKRIQEAFGDTIEKPPELD